MLQLLDRRSVERVATCVLDALALSRKRDEAMTSLLGRASQVGEVRWFVPIFKVKGKQPALCYQHTLPYTLLYACNHITTSHAIDIVLLQCNFSTAWLHDRFSTLPARALSASISCCSAAFSSESLLHRTYTLLQQQAPLS